MMRLRYIANILDNPDILSTSKKGKPLEEKPRCGPLLCLGLKYLQRFSLMVWG